MYGMDVCVCVRERESVCIQEQSNSESLRDQIQENYGKKMPGKWRANAGQILGKCWANGRQMAGKWQANSWQMGCKWLEWWANSKHVAGK